MRFEARFPTLFHVADRAAVESIGREGLLTARALVARYGGDAGWLRGNREGYCELAPGVALRRQGMRDGALRPRLDPAIPTEAWRWFINGMAFLFGREAEARRFMGAEPGRAQVILRYETAAVLAAGVALRVCRFNNGYIDRSPVATARRRRFDDYRAVAEWAGTPVREVAAPGGIPAGVGFAVLSDLS